MKQFNGRKNNSAANKNKSNNSSYSTNGLVCRASGHERAYQIGTINGSGGVLLPESGVAATTDTGGRYTIVLPESIGVRCSQHARLYNEYKINKLKFHYIPNSYQLGTQSLSTITAFQGNAYAGITRDPTIGILTQSELVEAGGYVFNFARGFVFELTSNRWLYTSPRVSDTLSDNRFVSPGILNFQSNFNGTATALKLGELWVEWDISFRYPIDADAEALSLTRQPLPHGGELLSMILEARLPKKVRDADDHKEDDVIKVVSQKE